MKFTILFVLSHPDGSLEQAIRFAYLNRLCWNGVYRVNKTGLFNVPIGSRLPKVLWTRIIINLLSMFAGSRNTCIRRFRFNRHNREGDFLFIDPPYPKGAPGWALTDIHLSSSLLLIKASFLRNQARLFARRQSHGNPFQTTPIHKVIRG